MNSFADSLDAAVVRCKNPVLVGIDPRADMLPPTLAPANPKDRQQTAEAYQKFSCEIIDAVASLVPAIKPQAAFFEELGPAGMTALAHVIRYAQQQGLLVIVDGKRNDIGSTAMAYARGFLGRQSAWGADALTVQ